ncbi:MAG: aspartate aminotransferase family protein [Clostridia bacterium]|nr:aspartate aminotransferase family protein [Clostridia bacterium]
MKQIDKQYVANTYKRFDLEIVSGKGSLVYDETGKEYIDMGSGIGVTALGHGDEGWKAAVTDQLDRISHTSNLYYTHPCARLAEQLCARTGMSKVFFSNSGAEANECAIKLARKYTAERKGADSYTIITLEQSFHGRTLTTLAATGQEHFHKLFQPLTDGFIHVPANDLSAFQNAVANHKVAGILMECVQGEGGVRALDQDYVKGVAQLCQEHDIVLMIDEVQSGNGRSGALYSYMNYGIAPDVVSTAKGLAGGLPLGATLMSEKMESVLGFGDHGSTFGGNPIACAAAEYVLSRMDEAMLADVRKKSQYIFDTLSNADGVEAVTGMGLMIGIKTVKPAAEVVAACMKQGVLCLTAKDKVRLLPALNIPMETLEKAIEIIRSVVC